MPPSPSLSACKTMKTYFIVTMRVSDQMMSERTWVRSFFVGRSEKVDENTYKGLGRMSAWCMR